MKIKGNTAFDVADTEWMIIFTAPAALHNSRMAMDTAVCVDAVPCVAYSAADSDRQSKQQFSGDFSATGYMTAKWMGWL